MSRSGGRTESLAAAGARRAVPRALKAPAPRSSAHPSGHAAFGTWRSTLALGQRAIVTGLALIVLVGFVAGTIEQRRKELQLRAQVATREADLRTAEERNAQLSGQLAANDPDGYRSRVEDTARRQLNLGYPDETVVLVNWAEPPSGVATPAPGLGTTPSAPPAPEPNWKAWLRLLTGE